MIAGTAGSDFVDAHGRRLLLRGVNLGGNSKIPFSPDGRTHLPVSLDRSRRVSFVARPFPLEEADEHFSNLARWGQRFVRFLVTWEAIEHEGPGVYDTAYLDYMEAIVERTAHHGISMFIDPHQDVWSRWTGGDGAPAWTLESVGFNPESLHASGAAMRHQEMGAAYPVMQWFSNHLRLGCATMFTLFFAGDEYAPGIRAYGEPVQQFLQRHYIAAMAELARRLSGYPNVAGFGTMNEPGMGYIGVADIRAPRQDMVLPGLAPTPWEAMRAGEGLPVNADHIDIKGLRLARIGRKPLGSPGVRAWKEGQSCVWRRVGIWDIRNGEAVLLKPDWFQRGASGQKAYSGRSPQDSFNQRFLIPFLSRFSAEIRAAARETAGRIFSIFIEGSPLGTAPSWPQDIAMPSGLVNASHWYDSLTLTAKRWTGFLAYDSEKSRLVVGPRAVSAYFRTALAAIKNHSTARLGGIPTFLGEFGLPFDLNRRRAYRTGRFDVHEKALAAYYDALDANLMSATLWNYTPDNTHDHGDGWNGEDLSVFCREDGGGRALRGFVRPYAMAVAGKLCSMSFSLHSGLFRLEFIPDFGIEAPTEVYVPELQYPRGFSMEAEGASASEVVHEADFSILALYPLQGALRCTLTVRRRRG